MHSAILNAPTQELVYSDKNIDGQPIQAQTLIGSLPKRRTHRIHTQDRGWLTIPIHLVYRVAGFPAAQPEYVCKIRRAHLEAALILNQMGYFSAIHSHPESVYSDCGVRSSFYKKTLQSTGGLLENVFPMFSPSTLRRRLKFLEKGRFIRVNKDEGSYGYFSVQADKDKRLAFDKKGIRLSVSPALAKEIGFIESIILLQLDFLLNSPKHKRKITDANRITWLLMTLRNFEQIFFPFLSHKTIFEYFRKLKDKGYVWINFDRKKPTYFRKTAISLNYENIRSLKSVCQIVTRMSQS